MDPRGEGGGGWGWQKLQKRINARLTLGHIAPSMRPCLAEIVPMLSEHLRIRRQLDVLRGLGEADEQVA